MIIKQFTDSGFKLSYLVIIIIIFLSSCQKAPINGDLDGQWQVMEVIPEPEEKLLDERIYYCFYLHVCQLTYYDGVCFAGNMEFDGETLYLDFPYADNPTREKWLRQYGITGNPITFTVEHLDKKSLIIKHGDTTVTMRKF
ncbi:MAG: lipocalin family protein [Bacteroides sp.]|nr:lipocalin family protein [Bacteroides sp.]